MKKILQSLLLLICVVQLPAQKKIADSLYDLGSPSNSEARVNWLNRIAYAFRADNADSAFKYATQALDLSQKINYKKGEASATLITAYLYSSQSKYELSKEFANKGLAMAQQIKNDSLIASAKLYIGGYHYNKSNYDDAIKNDMEALKIFETINEPQGVIRAKTLMAQVYQLQGKLPMAEKIIKECFELLKQSPNTVLQLSLMHTLANVYGMQNKFADALALDSAALKLCDAIGNRLHKSEFHDNMANCFLYAGDFQKAYDNYIECLKIDSSFDNKKQMGDTYLNLGNLFMTFNKYGGAIAYFNYSIHLADITGYRQSKFQALKSLSETYAQMGQADKALVYLKQSYQLKDSLFNSETESKIAELETVYETEKKEQQLSIQKASITKKNYALAGLAGILALLILLGVTTIRKRAVQSEMRLQSTVMKQQDIATRAVLTAEENERKRIAADLHDGVGQMMSVAKMNLSAFENDLGFKTDEQKLAYEKVIGLVDESCKEIRNISHQMMPNALLKSGLSSAVKEFIDKIDSRLLKVNLHTEGLNERLDNNVETVLYRVIQECVNNVIKHSGANMLDISIIKDNDGISATIEDNGRGFDATNKEKFEGIGFKNIMSRVEYLKGTLDIDTSPGKGALIAIHVPLS